MNITGEKSDPCFNDVLNHKHGLNASLLICMTNEAEPCCSQLMNDLDNPPAGVCPASAASCGTNALGRLY